MQVLLQRWSIIMTKSVYMYSTSCTVHVLQVLPPPAQTNIIDDSEISWLYHFIVSLHEQGKRK